MNVDGWQAELEDEVGDPLDPRQVATLAALVAPPDDLGLRTRARVHSALSQRSSVGIVIDVLGVGWQTLRVIVGSDEPEQRNT